MSRGMAQNAGILRNASTATLGFVDNAYPYWFVDGVTDFVYGEIRGGFQSLDPTGPVVFRTLCRTSGAPSGQVVNMTITYKIHRLGATVSATSIVSFAAVDLTANKNPGVTNSEWRWITWQTIEPGVFEPNDFVHIRFQRNGGAGDDTLGTTLYIPGPGFSFFYPVTRPGGLG